jgi:hypothetical protein
MNRRVFCRYTGERSWEALISLCEVVECGGEDFVDVVPQLRPLFLNLAAVPAEDGNSFPQNACTSVRVIRFRSEVGPS